MAKYLGESGLGYLWGKIKAWVQNYAKITSSTGKDTITAGNNSIDVYDWAQASTKPSYTQDEVADGTTYKRFSSTEQSKLSGIATGAEVNQNAFSNIKVGSTTVAADSKTDTVEFVGSGVTITPDATNDKITFTVPAGVSPYTSNPAMNGTASAGSSALYSRGDHVHPSDTSKADKSATVSNVAYDATNHKITKTINGTTSDVTTAATIVTDGGGILTTQKGVANGVCPLDANSLIDAQYLPSYVDDVVEAYARTGQTALSSTWLATGSASGTVITPEAGKIYVLMAASGDYPENSEFRWGGSTYVKINDGGIAEMTTAEMDTATNNWS